MEPASPRQHPLPSATGNQGAKHPLKPLEPIRERGGIHARAGRVHRQTLLGGGEKGIVLYLMEELGWGRGSREPGCGAAPGTGLPR